MVLLRAPWFRRGLFRSAALAGIGGAATAAAAAEPPASQTGAVDVRQFGAKGDARADDAPAINRAIQFLREHQTRRGPFGFVPRLLFPTGVYAVDSTINLSGLQALNAVIAGEGAVILGRCRGEPIIDALGSRWLTIRDITIVGEREATPRCGLQIGRLTNGSVADSHRLSNVKFVGHYELACLINFAAVTTGFDHVFCWNERPDPASYCLIQDGLNHFGTISNFVANQQKGPERNHSFNENEFLNCDFRHGGGGIPVWLGDTRRHRFYRCYAASSGSASFLVYCGPNSHTMLDVDCHCETRGLQTAFTVTGQAADAVIRGFSYKDHGTFAARAAFARQDPVRHATLQHARIEIGAFAERTCRMLDDPASWTITGEVYIADPPHWNGDKSFAGTLFLGGAVYESGVRRR
jgi:hypothetical protein